jgi:hypothetical protein
MNTANTAPTLVRLFAELVNGTGGFDGGYIVNTGDIGLVKSIEKLSAADASRSTNDGATIAAHVQHERYGLSLMNRWAREGGNPFADAKWDEAWKTREVDARAWDEIRNGFAAEARQWLEVLRTPREVSETELNGLVASIAHFAYHMGAIRQIDRQARGPKEGTFPST